MAFSEDFLEQLSERSDSVEVVSEYVQLKNKGSNLFGICPFHSEKTPSFSVSPEKQFFHCFGCGVGGGVINFIMQIENLDFADAVRFLSAKVGIAVPEDGDTDTSKRRSRILELNKLAARYFYETLMAPNSKNAREYLKNRGFSESTVRRFGIGYAPDLWDGLIKNIKGFEKSELLDGRLAVKNKSGGIFDMFRGRIMFPIIDIRGNVIAFGGRIMGDGQPKYLNSPETLVFNKSKNLFALNIAKKSRSKRIILAEGYMDVIALHQAGFDTAVASLGTSLTESQARLLAKYATEVVIAFDTDEAGRNAANRAISILEKTGIQVKLVTYPGAKDPDEYIQKFGADAFALRLDRSENHIEYRLLAIKAKYNTSEDDQRILFLKEASDLISTLYNPVERAVYAAKVAEAGAVTVSVIEEEANLAAKKRFKSRQKKELRATLTPAQTAQPKARELRYKNIRSAIAEEGILSLILADESLIEKVSQKLTPDDFSSEALGKAYNVVLSVYNSGRGVSTAILSQSLDSREMEQFGKVVMREPAEGDRDKAMEDYIDIILAEKHKNDSTDGDTILKEWERLREKKGIGGHEHGRG